MDQKGRGRHPIGIIIPEDSYAFPLLDGFQDTINGLIHIFHQGRVRKVQ